MRSTNFEDGCKQIELRSTYYSWIDEPGSCTHGARVHCISLSRDFCAFAATLERSTSRWRQKKVSSTIDSQRLTSPSRSLCFIHYTPRNANGIMPMEGRHTAARAHSLFNASALAFNSSLDFGCSSWTWGTKGPGLPWSSGCGACGCCKVGAEPSPG